MINVRNRHRRELDSEIALRALEDFCKRVPREVIVVASKPKKPKKKFWTRIKNFFKNIIEVCF